MIAVMPRRTQPVRAANPHTWEVYSLSSGRVLGRYAKADYRAAVRDAAILTGTGMPAQVRKAV